MKNDSKILRLVFTSPWSILFFLVIPLLVVLSVSLRIHVPFAGSKYPLLYNNACFALFVAIRLLYYLMGMTRSIRYGSASGAPRQFLDSTRPVGAVKNVLVNAGYICSNDGNYCEKRDLGYLGTLILYAGLLVVLFTGTWDNMHQYSGTLLDGVGASTDLNRAEAYRHLVTGPLTRKPATLPKMKIIKQMIPDSNYPRGASEIALLFMNGKEQTTIFKPHDIYRAGAYDIYMTKMVYEPIIAITINDATPVFNGQITLNQMPKKVDGFGFYGTFSEGVLNGEVYYQPEKSRLRVVVHQRDEQLINSDLVFQVDRLSRSANFAIKCEKMGVWSEIHVVHRRHLNIIWFGGIVALIGLLMRIAIRPRRVWLEETPEGSRVRAVGKETVRLVQGI